MSLEGLAGWSANDPAALERGAAQASHPLWSAEIGFVLGVASLTQLPAMDRPEVCFAGRSNVGKSSLLNALTGRRGLARASNTPGRTRELNYFSVGQAFYLVDLPGYGYAQASKEAIKRWTRLTDRFLEGRASLRRVYLLLDSRHGIKPPDLDLMARLDTAAVSYQVVLTKADKPKPSELSSVYEAVDKAVVRHPAAHPNLLVTSAEKGGGIAELRQSVAQLVEQG